VKEREVVVKEQQEETVKEWWDVVVKEQWDESQQVDVLYNY
jgi:hypothetical protein